MRNYRFWQLDGDIFAFDDQDKIKQQYSFHINPNAVLLYEGVFETYHEFKRFFTSLKKDKKQETVKLLNIPSNDLLSNEYSCGAQVGDALTLEYGFSTDIDLYTTSNFSRKAGKTFFIEPQIKSIPDIIWLSELNSNGTKMYYPIKEEDLSFFSVSDKKQYKLENKRKISRVFTSFKYLILIILLVSIFLPVIIGFTWHSEIKTFLLQHKFASGSAIIIASVYFLTDEVKNRKERLNWPIDLIFWCVMLVMGISLLFGVKLF